MALNVKMSKVKSQNRRYAYKKRSLPSQAGFPFKQNETTKIHYAQKQNGNLV